MNFKNSWLYGKPARFSFFLFSAVISVWILQKWRNAPGIQKGQDYDELCRSFLILVAYYFVSLFIHQFFSLLKVGFMKKSSVYELLFWLFSANFLVTEASYGPMSTMILAIVSLIIQMGRYLYLFKNINFIKKE